MLVRRNRFGAYRFSIKRPGIKDPHRCIGTTTDVYLYEPRDAWRLGGGGGFGPAATGRGENPPRGAVIHYVLKKERDKDAEPITLEILDDAGAVIRTFSSAETELDRCMRENTEPRNRREVELLETGAGMNRWVWDLRRQPLHCVPDVRLFQGWEGRPGGAGDVPGAPDGGRADRDADVRRLAGSSRGGDAGTIRRPGRLRRRGDGVLQRDDGRP